MKVGVVALLSSSRAYTIQPVPVGTTVQSVVVSTCGYYIVTQDERTARVWGGGRNGVELQRLEGHTAAINAVAVTPTRGIGASPWVVTGSDDGSARIWDLNTGVQLRLLGHSVPVTAVVISPDDTFVVTGSDDNAARIWDASSGAELMRLDGHFDRVRSVAVSPDNAYVATGSDDRTVRIWAVSSGIELVLIPNNGLRQFSESVRSVEFGADGTYVVAGAYERTARIFDASSGVELQRCISGSLPKHAESICEEHSSTLRFASPDGVHAFSGSTPNPARILASQSGPNTGSGFGAATLPQDRSKIEANKAVYGDHGGHERRRRA